MWLFAYLAITIGLVLTACAGAPGQPVSGEDPTAVSPEGEDNDATLTDNPKLDSALNQLLDAYRTQGTLNASAFAEERGMALEGNSVWVIVITTPGEVDGLTKVITEAGGQVRGHYEGRLEALVPIEQLEVLAGRPEVKLIEQPAGAIELSPM